VVHCDFWHCFSTGESAGGPPGLVRQQCRTLLGCQLAELARVCTMQLRLGVDSFNCTAGFCTCYREYVAYMGLLCTV